MFIGYGYVVVVYFTQISVRNNFAYYIYLFRYAKMLLALYSLDMLESWSFDIKMYICVFI